MDSKIKLMVSINGGEFLEMFKCTEEKIMLEFKPIPDEPKQSNMRITTKEGMYVDFLCVREKTNTNAIENY